MRVCIYVCYPSMPLQFKVACHRSKITKEPSIYCVPIDYRVSICVLVGVGVGSRLYL